MSSTRAALIWVGLTIVLAVPIVMAATSPLLAWRDPIYIASGFAGVVAMALVLIQPLLIGGYLPGLSLRPGRRLHQWVGGSLVIMVVAHVGGLWLTSPPDVIDALLLDSPTPFSVWGVAAMWSCFAAALLAAFRSKIGIGTSIWRVAHTSLAIIVVIGSVIHALLIEGTMESTTKAGFCLLVLISTAKVVFDLRSLETAGTPQCPDPNALTAFWHLS